MSIIRRLPLLALFASAAACNGVADESGGCGRPVEGTEVDWHLRGAFSGYEAQAGCAGSEVVIVVTGDHPAGGVPADAPTSERGPAITDLYHDVIAPEVDDVASWVGYGFGDTCLGHGMYGVIELFDWGEVDGVVTRVGARLSELGYAERIGVSLRPLRCAELR